MTLALGSVLLSLLNLASAALIAERRRAGWLVALAAQIPWTWYDLRTGQLGFLLLTLIYVPVYVRGWRKARKLAHLPSGTAGGSPAAETAETPGATRRWSRWLSRSASGCPAAMLPRPAVPFGSARWIYLLLGLSWRSTQASDGDGGLPLLQASRSSGTAPD